MLKILSRLLGKERAEIIDARRVYQKVMEQSRNAMFYGDNLCADCTDGRMEILCMHLSTVLFILRNHDDNGSKLSQALYDVMIQDFDVALREEGLSDTGVSRRIKPLANMFFARAQLYADAFSDVGEGVEDRKKSLGGIIDKYILPETTGINTQMRDVFAEYALDFLSELQSQSLGAIAQAQFNFPKFIE